MIEIERTTFEDGDRFVIVYKNCDPKLKARILKSLAAAEAGLEEQELFVSEESEIPVYPITDPIPEIPEIPEVTEIPDTPKNTFAKGPYKGLTAEDVLKEHGDNGYGNLAYLLQKEKDAQMKKAIKNAMTAYFNAKFQGEDPYKLCGTWDETQVEQFMKIFGFFLLTDENKKKVCETVGAIDFDTYIAEAGLDVRRSLAAAIIEKNVR